MKSHSSATRIERAVSIADLRRMARRRVPKLVFDYIEGGADDEDCVLRNVEQFAKYRLVPRYLVDVSTRSQAATLFGRNYASPFGVAPTGFNGFARHGADLSLARAAATADIPFVLSGAGTASIEAAAEAAPNHTWYQLYVPRDRSVSDDILKRTGDAGIEVLVVTVDVPVQSKRERDIRNGFALPPRPTLRAILEASTHPAWLASLAIHGLPALETWLPYSGTAPSSRQTIATFTAQIPFTQTWRDLEALRRAWRGRLVVKGILHCEDATRAADIGVDGLILSNHGGRQLDRAASALELLPAVRAAVGKRLTLMVDGGIRRGSDIAVALALGADFVLTGRATLYGVVAGGTAGATKAIQILRHELNLTLGQLGCSSVADLGPEVLLRSAEWQ